MSSMPVGIDLGTTYSLIAVLTASGQPQLVPGAEGAVLTPSAVGLSDNGALLVGAPAKARQLTNPDKTHVTFKRHMGTGKEFRLDRKNYSASDLSALVLRKLVADFKATYPDTTIENLVISVPAYFSSAQREATVLAAELAGLPRPRLVNEPTAAALAYGLQDREGESTFIVLDLGGGTFDVSIIEMFEGVMEVRASSGDVVLGGEDFTEAIAQDIARKLSLEWDAVDGTRRSSIVSAAEAIKLRLSDADSAHVTLPFGDGKEYALTREGFEFLSERLLIALRRPIDRCLYDADIAAGAIDRVVLAGGATRMPMIRSLAARALRRFPEAGIDPDQVVALGAAVQAGLIQRNAALRDLAMTDVAPFSLGIKSRLHTPAGIIENAFSPIIERSTILPASRTQRYSTVSDYQDRIELGVFQGESPLAKDNARIGETTIWVPRAKAGEESIDVRFSYDTSGLLHVGVTVVSTGKTSEIVIEGGAQSLSAAEKSRRIKALEGLMVHPRDESVNLATLERLRGLYGMLLGQDRKASAELLAFFEAAIETQDPRRIAEARKQVEAAAKRMEDDYVR